MTSITGGHHQGDTGAVAHENDQDAAILALEAGGSGVSSVNTRTGAVTLTADDTPDGSTNKAYTATEKTKLAGIATAATANLSDALLMAGETFKAPTGVYQPSMNQQSASSTTLVGVASGAMTFVPFRVIVTQSFDRIAIQVGSVLAGGTSVAIALGVYNDSGNGVGPSTRVVDGGSVSLASAAVATVTISQSLTPGLYWLGAAFTYSVAPTTLAVFTIGGGSPGLPGSTFTNNYRGYTATGVAAGALPSTAPAVTSQVANVIAMALRAA